MSTRSVTPTVAAPVPVIMPVRGGVLQRTCDCGQHTVGGAECEDCKKKKGVPLQRRADGSAGPPSTPSIVHEVLRSQGQPLDEDTRAFFEPRFGHDFSRVRVHSNSRAAESARSVNALAYTVGNNVVFGAGQYSPARSSGKRLLAHELTHVVQQHNEAPPSPQYRLEVGPVEDRFEQEADRIAERVTGGTQATEETGSTLPTAHATTRVQRAAATSPEAEAAQTRTAAPLLVEDDAHDLQSGQMRKGEFLDKLQVSVCAAADDVLSSVGRTTQACPYLARWIGHLRAKESHFVERGVRKYAPESAGATKAQDYIPLVTARVRRGVTRWASTGEITEVPEELRGQLFAANVFGVAEHLISGIGGAIDRAASAVAGGVKKAVSAIGSVFAKERDGGVRDAGSPQEVQAQLGEGQRLDSRVRSRMEEAFGGNFADVRVHADTTAAGLSTRLNARAFTIGRDVAFGAGEYQPGTLIGDALIAHELAHVIQQGSAPDGIASKVNSAAEYSALEEDADLSAVGAVVSLWSDRRASLDAIGRRSLPSLRSGLRLQRCGGTHPELEMVSGRHVGDIPGSVNNLKEEVLAAMDRLNVLSLMPNADYNVEHRAVSALPAGSSVPTETIPKTIAAVGRLSDTTLNPPVASTVLGITLTSGVGKGQANQRPDILVLQDALHVEWGITNSDYATERAAVNGLATPTVPDSAIPKTIAGIAKMKRDFVAGMIRRDLFAGTRAVTETQHANIEHTLNPTTILVPPPPVPEGVAPPPPVVAEPDPMTDTGPGGLFETQMLHMLTTNIGGWAVRFRALKAEAGQPAFPIASANNIAHAAQGEVERYYAPFIRTATRAPGEKYHPGAYSLTDKLGDASTRPLTTPDRKGWLNYFMTLRHPNCISDPCGQKILDDHKYIEHRDRAERVRVRDLYLTSPANVIDLNDTIHSWEGEASTGTVFIQPYARTAGEEGRKNRWKNFKILLHEMMHIVSHPNFAAAATRIGGTAQKILDEGFAEIFTREIWSEAGALKSRLPNPEMSEVRQQVEGGKYDYDAGLVGEPTYYDQLSDASAIDAQVGRPNSKAAFFLGHVELLGIGAGTRSEGGPLAGVGMYEPDDDPNAQVIVAVAGDSYANVLTRTGATPGALLDAATNVPLPVAAPIAAGARIRIPGIRWTRAIAHDTLGGVAQQHQVPVAALALANGFPAGAPPATPLVVGTRVLIPIHRSLP